MRKQFMTLALCLALTATSAMATTCTKAKATPKKAPMAAVKPVANKVETPTLTPEQAARQKFEARMIQDREDLYCKLGLSAEQKAKAEDLHNTSRAKAEPLMAKLHEEKAKLRDLKEKKACPVKIAEQKAKVHEAKAALNENRKAFMKDFDAILDKDQLAKFKALKEEKKAEFKKCKCHHHNHHHHQFLGHDEDAFHAPAGAPEGKPAPQCPCVAK